MVGLALAVALAKAGLEVTVADRLDPSQQRDDAFDGRSSAIARGSQQVLQGLGLWTGMAAAAAPILDIRISDGRPYDSGLGDGGPYDDGRGSRRPGNASTLHLHFRSEEPTSELQSLMRISFAVFCLKKKKKNNNKQI